MPDQGNTVIIQPVGTGVTEIRVVERVTTRQTIAVTNQPGSAAPALPALPAEHQHPIGDVEGLQAALDGKAPSSHTHSGLETRMTAAESTLASLTTPLDLTRTFTAVGVSSAFSNAGRTSLLVTLTAPAGVTSALVQVETEDGLTKFGSIDFPNGSPQRIKLTPGTYNLVLRARNFTGSGTLSANVKG